MKDFTQRQYLNSINYFNEAQQVITGGVNSPVRAFSATKGTPPFIARAEGHTLIDVDGNSYVDFVQSFGPQILGHADEDVTRAICHAASLGTSFGAPTREETTLAKLILSAYDGIEKVRLVSSGTEAVMSAIRLARAFSGKEDILKFDGCYHGHSDSLLVSAGSGLATSGIASSAGVIEDLAKHTYVARYNDIQSVKECFDRGNIGVVVIEPIAGNMGLVPADSKFLSSLRALCDEMGAVLIFDEVMSGFRASLGGSLEFCDVLPDMATFGKVIGGGLPLAAFAGRAEIMDLLAPSGPVYQAGTLSGNPLAVMAGITTLKKLNKEIFMRLDSLADRISKGMQRLARDMGISLVTTHRGSMFGFFFNESEVCNFDDAKKSNLELFAKFHRRMIDLGVYFACSTFETNFICASMNEAVIDGVLEKIGATFEQIRR